jgi:hypothetical protein
MRERRTAEHEVGRQASRSRGRLQPEHLVTRAQKKICQPL